MGGNKYDDFGSDGNLGVSSGKKNQIPIHRGYSSKNPKTSGLAFPSKQRLVEEDYYFEDDEAEVIEQRQHNFKIGGAVKPAAKNYTNELTSEDDLLRLCKEHENLIDLILEEEEEVTNAHKEEIDQEVETVKEEMKLLYEVQKPNSDIKQYVEILHSIIDHKLKMLVELKQKVEQFGDHLLQEEQLSEEFKVKQEDARNNMMNG